jgi:hypothetical protein
MKMKGENMLIAALEEGGGTGTVSKVKDGQKSIRIVMPTSLYNQLKEECQDHGDISKLVRRLLKKHLESLVKV